MMFYNLEKIQSILDLEKAILMQQQGFQYYSEGKVTAPPVGYMDLGRNFGEVHIKSGWIQGDDLFVVKIAGAYHQNPEKHNLAVVQGLMLALDSKTGQTKALLQDEGYLTNLRTAIAGLIAAKYLAPKTINGIGVIGTGTQARLQIELLRHLTDCKNLWVYGRNKTKVSKYASDMTSLGFHVNQVESPAEICEKSRLIVTATAAKEPLIHAEDIQPGTHITAVGADAPGKQELDPKVFQLAHIIAVDSKSQCLDHGEVYHANQAGILSGEDLIELGNIIANPKLHRQSDNQITIADLTGVSVQDIQIAKSIINDSF